MEKFIRVTGIAAPLLRINVDTDQIIPGPEIVGSDDDSYERWGRGLFANWRYDKARRPNPDFILNQEPWRRAVILLSDRNFGCGSSREPAPKALRGFGIRAVLAPSFGGIFYNNSFRHGLLPVELPIEQVREIARQVEAAGGLSKVTVDLQSQQVIAPGGEVFRFHTPLALRRMLLEGLDEIDQTLSRQPEITSFRQRDRDKRPWVYTPGATT